MSLKGIVLGLLPRFGVALLAGSLLAALPASAFGAAARCPPAASTAKPVKARAATRAIARHAPKKARALPKHKDAAKPKPPARPAAAQPRSVAPAK